MDNVPEEMEQPSKPRVNAKSSLALEKLKRRATTIRSFSSSVLSESINESVLTETPSEGLKPPNPLFAIRRSNSARNRLSMPLGKLLEAGKELAAKEFKAPASGLNEEDSKRQERRLAEPTNAPEASSRTEDASGKPLIFLAEQRLIPQKSKPYH